MPAFGSAVANLRAIRGLAAMPESVDAMAVLDTSSMVGAASSQGVKLAAETAAKEPPPKITLDLVSGRMTADVPLTSGAQRVTDAKNKPYEQYAAMLEQLLGQSSRLAQSAPDPEQLPSDPKALAEELGVNEPGFSMQDGVFGLMRRKDEYQRLTKDPAKLRQAVAARRLKAKMDFMGEGAQAYGALRTVQNEGRADDREARQEAITKETFLQHMLAKDPLGYGSPEKYLETVEGTMKNVFGDDEGKLTDSDRARALNEYATSLRKREIEDLKEKERKADNDEDRRTTRLQIAAAEKRLSDDEKPRRARRVSTSESYLGRASADQLIGRTRDEGYDQESAFEAVDMAADQWKREIEKNSSEHDQNAAEIKAPDTPIWKRDRLKERQKWLQQRNGGLVTERNKLLQFLGADGQEATPPPTSGALRPPPGKTLAAPAPKSYSPEISRGIEAYMKAKSYGAAQRGTAIQELQAAGRLPK